MKVLLFIFMILCAFVLPAQENKVVMGKTYTTTKQSQIGGIVARYKQQTYLIRFGHRGPSIEQLDSNLSFVANYPILLSYKTKPLTYQGVFQSRNNLIVLTSFYNQIHKKHYLFARKINLDSINQTTPLVKLAEVEEPARRVEVDFNHDMSVDSSKIIIYSAINITNNSPAKFAFRVFDRDLNLLWEKKMSAAVSPLLFDPHRVEVANNGDVYLSGLELSPSRKFNTGSEGNNHILFYKDRGQTVKDFELDFGDKTIEQLVFGLDSSSNLRCGGFYSENDELHVSGTFLITVDNHSGTIVTKSFDSFARQEFIRDSSKEKGLLRPEDLEDYRIRDFVIKHDGGIILLAEQYVVQVDRTDPYSFQSVRNNRSTVNYYFKDILAVSLNENGKIEWQTQVPKFQHSTDDGGYFSSFATFIVNGNIQMIYNESAKNYYDRETYRNLEKQERRAYYLVGVKLNRSGGIQKTIILNNKDSDVIIRPKTCRQHSPNSALLYGKWQKKQRFGRIVYEEKK